MTLIIAILTLVLFLEVRAHAGSRTLEELLADERAGSVEIGVARNRRDILEQECDCVIEHGVKIHGYPGAWSRRNRLNRDRSLDVYIHGDTGAEIGIDAK